MNKKGFTLVELLAVVVVLGLIITITATKGFGAFNNVKDKIEAEDMKMIFNSLNNLLVEVESCDDELDEYNELKPLFYGGSAPITSEQNCEGLKKWLYRNEKAIVLAKLGENKYLTAEQMEKLKKEAGYGKSDTLIRARYNTNTNKGRIPYIRVRDRLYFDEVLISNNQGVHNSKAVTTISFKTISAGKLSFDWSVSSEEGYDKLNVILYTGSGAGEYIVNNKSGVQNGTVSEKLGEKTEYKIKFMYSKDFNQNNNADTATISNLSITSKVEANGSLDYYRDDGENCKITDINPICYYFDN